MSKKILKIDDYTSFYQRTKEIEKNYKKKYQITKFK